MNRGFISFWLALLCAWIAMIALSSCSPRPDDTPTLIVCQEGGQVIHRSVVPRAAIRPCFWDIGHNGTCIGDLVFGPAVPCMYGPWVAPQPTPVPQQPPSPGAVERKGKKR